MELSFEYYDWLKYLNENSFLLIFISIFGSLIFLIALGITRLLLKGIGLRFIADWKFLDDLMICIFLTGFFGGFLILLLSVVFIPEDIDGMNAIRYILILTALFMCIFSFYITNKSTLRKWYDEVVAPETRLPEKEKTSVKRKKSKKRRR